MMKQTLLFPKLFWSRSFITAIETLKWHPATSAEEVNMRQISSCQQLGRRRGVFEAILPATKQSIVCLLHHHLLPLQLLLADIKKTWS